MDGTIGTIMLFAGNYAPYGWAICNGQMMSMAQNTALYSIIGTIYGGDGKTTFALPNLSPLKDVDGQGESNYIICLQGAYPMRE